MQIPQQMTLQKVQWNSLAIHPVGHSTMTWNALAKILDVKSALEAWSKESSKGGNQWCKASKRKQMQLIRCIWNCVNRMACLENISGYVIRGMKHDDALELSGKWTGVSRARSFSRQKSGLVCIWLNWMHSRQDHEPGKSCSQSA